MKRAKVKFDVKQGNFSENLKKGTLRGFHYQKSSKNDSKILSCVSGSLINVTVDLRRRSETFLKSCILKISSKSRESIYIPAGCANAFMTLENDTNIHYYMNEYYNKKNDSGFRYDDPTFNVKWPYRPKVISKKDLSFENFSISKL